MPIDTDLASALNFDMMDDLENRIDSLFEGGIVDIFTYQDLKGRAQRARKGMSRDLGPSQLINRARDKESLEIVDLDTLYGRRLF